MYGCISQPEAFANALEGKLLLILLLQYKQEFISPRYISWEKQSFACTNVRNSVISKRKCNKQ